MNGQRFILILGAIIAIIKCNLVAETSPAISQPRVISMRELGVLPNTSEDSATRINQAVRMAAENSGASQIEFESGTYRLNTTINAPNQPPVCIPIEGLRNVLLRGTGKTKFVVTNPEAVAVLIRGCSNLRLEGIVIDYDPLPFTQGTIVSVDIRAGTFEMDLDSGYPDISQKVLDRKMKASIIPVWQAASEIGLVYGEIFHFLPLKKTGDRRWVFQTAENGNSSGKSRNLEQIGLKAGGRCVCLTTRGSYALAIIDSENVLVENVTIFSSPGLASYVRGCQNVTLRRYHVTIPQKTGRLFSSNADGVHARGNRSNVQVIECSFAGMGDDAINFHSSAILPLKVLSKNLFLFKAHTYSLRKGDLLEVVRPETAEVSGPFKVASAEKTPDGWSVVFDGDPGEIRPGTDFSQGDQLFNISEANSGFAIRGCRFGSFRGRAVVLSAINGTIEDNRFEVWHGCGINFQYDRSVFVEGPDSRNIKIRNNVFIGETANLLSIVMDSRKLRGGGVSEKTIDRAISIEGNRFENPRNSVVVMNGIRGLVIKDNIVLGTQGAQSDGTKRSAAFLLNNCPDAVVERNTVTDSLFENTVIQK